VPIGLRYCGIAVTEAYISAGGDSGGPWFFGNGARGIHTGRLVVGGASRSGFTAISHATTYMSTTVRTQ
jgi:hypothetical protein